VAVYNAAGELVETLLTGDFPQPVGALTLGPGNSITSVMGPGGAVTLYSNGALLSSWNGTNAFGNPVSNGTYFLRVDCVTKQGADQSQVLNVTVSRPLGKVAAEIYNGAGELVRTLYQVVGAGGPVTAVQLSSPLLQIGAGAPGPVTIALSDGVTLTWDGSADGGAMVTNGVYYLEVISDNGTGVEEVVTQELTVLNSGRAAGGVIAYPNPWQGGDPAITFQASSAQPLTLKVWLYDLAGEKVDILEGAPGTGQAVLQNPAFASGIYIAAVELRDANGNLTSRQSLKVLIRH
jgi:flagellar hook assembly protein FlgD